MKNFYLFFILFLLAGFSKSAIAQNISNEGSDFWVPFPTHDPSGSGLANMNIIVTSKKLSEVTVSCGTYIRKQTIPANTSISFEIPRIDSYINDTDGNKPITNRAIHVVVTTGMPNVVVYAHVYASARSAATLVLPKEALGQKYYSMNYTQDNQGNGVNKNFLVLIATEDNTSLILHKLDGSNVNITLLKAGDVYEYLPSGNEDLTGTFVEVAANSSCKRFAAFSGSTSITIGPCTGSRDPLFQQLYTVSSWGKNYGIVPFIGRRFIVRILAQEDNTAVKINGGTVMINKGRFYETTLLTSASIITADKLVSVAQYSLTQGCSTINGTNIIGDPDMVLLNPIEFSIKNITVFSSNQQAIVDRYVNVFMKTAKTATFRLNGSVPVNANWQTMPSDPNYSYIQIAVYDQSLTLTADDGFNAIAYGFGNAESYAYSAGTSLASSQFLVVLNKASKLDNQSACVGQASDLKLTVPYLLSKVTWKFSDGSTFVDDPLAAPVQTFSPEGTALYTYTSQVNKIFNTVGTTNITAIAALASASVPSCFVGTDLELNFTVEVNAIATANFDPPKDICAGAEIKFFDLSTDPNNSITQWKWDFDGVIKVEKDPTYIFTKPGTYTIKLSVANASGCWSEVVKTISINKYLPVIVFNKLDPICINANSRQLAALETLGLNATEKVFSGPGVSATGLFNPSIAGAGIHKITYTFTSVDGCINTATQDIEVYALPKISLLPIIYILAGGQKEIPAIVANANSKYRYKWTPASGLSSDDILNPIASPKEDTEYELSVTVDGMCEVTAKVLVKVLGEISPPTSFTPNGDGVNDTWNIKSIDSYPDANIEIFNRSGQKVFNSVGYTVPFDGTYHNEPLPVGVYYYIINPKNGRKAITGPLTIIR